MHQNTLIATFTCLLVQACSSAGNDRPNRAFTTNAPVPPIEVHNGAPLNNAAGYPEQARNTSPDPRAGAHTANSDRTASGTLVPVQGRRIRGEVRVQEVAESVRLEIEVENALPGTRRVAVRPGADCNALRRAPWKTPPKFASAIGALAIGRGGEAKTTLTVDGANLRPDSSASLLGSAVLLYGPERIAAESKGPELPIACADIASG